MAHVNFAPAEGGLRRSHAGLLKDNEPLLVTYLGTIPPSQWMHLFDTKHLISARSSTNNVPSFIGDKTEKYPCILLLNGNKTRKPLTTGAVIECIDYQYMAGDLRLIAFKVLRTANTENATDDKLIFQRFKPTESFLHGGTIRWMLGNTLAHYEDNVAVHLHLNETRLNLQNPQYARCDLTDGEYLYCYFNIKHEDIGFSNRYDRKSPESYVVNKGMFLISSFRVDENGEIFVSKCRQISAGQMNIPSGVRTLWELGRIPMNLLTESFRQEVEVKNLLDTAKLKLAKSTAWTTTIPDVNGNSYAYTFAWILGDNFNRATSDFFDVEIKQVSTGSVVARCYASLEHQRALIPLISIQLRKGAYSKMVCGEREENNIPCKIQ